VITSLFHGGVGAGQQKRALGAEALLRRQISGLIVACVSADQSYLAPWQARTPWCSSTGLEGLSGVYVIEDDLGGAVRRSPISSVTATARGLPVSPPR